MTLQIEAGKTYRTRQGEIVNIVKPDYKKWERKMAWADESQKRAWYAKGNYYFGETHKHDLVAEHIPEGIDEPTPAKMLPYVAQHDTVSYPKHYTGHPSGVECIQITEHMNFCRGNAVKYIWRAGEKGNEVEDLKKAVWYLQREIARIEKNNA